MAIIVSGASGFLGRRLIDQLAVCGEEVVAVSRQTAPAVLQSHSNVHWITLDIGLEGIDPNGLPPIDTVVHLAGATLGAGTDENIFFNANEQTTVRLCQSISNQIDRFIYASSQAVYGDANSLSITENFALMPDGSAYACSKLNSENWLRWFQKKFGGTYIALRFSGFVEGGGIVDYIIDQAIAGNPIELFSEGRIRRDYLAVNEGINALIGALSYQDAPGFLPVNIGSGQSVSAHELAIHICDEIGSSSIITLLPDPGPQSDFVFCIDRAVELFHFKPSDLVATVRCHARQRYNKTIGQE